MWFKPDGATSGAFRRLLAVHRELYPARIISLRDCIG